MAMQREPESGVIPGQENVRLSVIVRIPTPLRKLTNDQDVVSGNGETLTQCIDGLDAQYPGLKDRLVDETGELRRFVNIYINGEDVRFAQGVQTAVKPGDEISIVPAVAGGAEEPRAEPRLKYYRASPGAYQALKELQDYVEHSGLERALMELVKVRASQLNSCAFCLDMHWKEARAAGEREDRLYMLNVWRESHVYSDRERAALAWTEAVTLISQTGAPDEVYEEARIHFDEKEISNLTLAIAAINAWNRMAIGFRLVPGWYEVRQAPARAASA
jgi:AhpD family alkylhydroperoxidase